MQTQSWIFHYTENLHYFKIIHCPQTFNLWGKQNFSISYYWNVSTLPLWQEVLNNSSQRLQLKSCSPIWCALYPPSPSLLPSLSPFLFHPSLLPFLPHPFLPLSLSYIQCDFIFLPQFNLSSRILFPASTDQCNQAQMLFVLIFIHIVLWYQSNLLTFTS